MAMDSLASAAHAAGFAMVPEDDTAATEHKAVAQAVVFSDTSARWQASSHPLPLTNEQTERSSGIFDWMPSFSWRADGR
jgi:hypothetical protein